MAAARNDKLADLYRELRRFAPESHSDEMALLAEKLAELRQASDHAVVAEQTSIEAIWERVASSFGDESKPVEDS